MLINNLVTLSRRSLGQGPSIQHRCLVITISRWDADPHHVGSASLIKGTVVILDLPVPQTAGIQDHKNLLNDDQIS